MTHVAGNVGGVLAGAIYMIVHVAMGGQLPTGP
jgi:hypothetical protein